MNDWDKRAEAFWAEVFDESAPQATIKTMRTLVAELPPTDARGPFELGGVFDALGMEEVAAAHYRKAVELGLDERRTAQLAVQHASTLRNLGRVDEAIDMLATMEPHPAVGAAQDAFLALALHSAGRQTDALKVALLALEPTLPAYRRSIREYIAALTEPGT